VNARRPDEVYNTLRTRLPFEETRNYIVNAVQTRRRYAMM
jgi:membrane-bound lytic murein transglycosylase C